MVWKPSMGWHVMHASGGVNQKRDQEIDKKERNKRSKTLLYELRHKCWKMKKKSMVLYIRNYLHQSINAGISKMKRRGSWVDVSGTEVLDGVAGGSWPQGSERLWQRNSPLGMDLLGISGKWRRGIQPAYCLRTIARERRKTWQLLLKQMSTRWRQSTFWTQVQGCRCTLRGRLHGEFGGIRPERFGFIFRAAGTLFQDASCQAEDTGVPSAFGVDWQSGWGPVSFETLRDSECLWFLQIWEGRATLHHF